MSQAPISTEYPSLQDLMRTRKLEASLQEEGVVESPEGYEKRNRVLANLNAFVKDWLYNYEIELGKSPEAAQLINAKIFTFGSFRLGVHSKNGDIDALICFPKSVTREAFFSSFYDALAKRDDVRELHSAESAAVPAIKLEFGGVEMDLLMAQLEPDSIAASLDLSDDDILRNLSDKCVRSVNGRRVTDKILELCPASREDFALCLRTIKLWAKRRGIYSNALGYLGGVHLAILVAKVCQLFPNASGAKLVEKFFWNYNRWDWTEPVQLQHVEDLGIGHLQHWSPINNYKDPSVMFILTPCYPSQNASFTVMQSTLFRIKKELARGEEVVQKVLAGKAPWSRLWRQIPFFGVYAHYVCVQALANSEQNRTLYEGLVESTVRNLVVSLEYHPAVTYAVPIPKAFRRSPEKDPSTLEGKDALQPPPEYCWRTLWFIGLILDPEAKEQLDILTVMHDFERRVRRKESFMTRYDPSMRYTVDPMSRNDLPAWLPAETKVTKAKAAKAPAKRKATPPQSTEAAASDHPAKKSTVSQGATPSPEQKAEASSAKPAAEATADAAKSSNGTANGSASTAKAVPPGAMSTAAVSGATAANGSPARRPPIKVQAPAKHDVPEIGEDLGVPGIDTTLPSKPPPKVTVKLDTRSKSHSSSRRRHRR